MASLMNFKIPHIPEKKREDKFTPIKSCNIFNWNEFFDLQEIGKGAFGTVLTANHPKYTEQVAIKKLNYDDAASSDCFLKEIKLIASVKHSNLVKLYGVCQKPMAMVLEYAFFDFAPFGSNEKCHSLSEFLKFTNTFACKGFADQVFPMIAANVVDAVAYLHANDIVHRDLKPSNVLVSNKHYNQLPEELRNTIMQKTPIICKVTDFGESRSIAVQTQTLLKTKTSKLDRGTIPFMSPEILRNNLGRASLEDLKKVDAWALGMVIFSIINPDLPCPFYADLADTCFANLREAILVIMRQGLTPTMTEKYIVERSTVWYHLLPLYVHLCQMDPRSRWSSQVANEFLKNSFAESSALYPLSVSQETALEESDRRKAINLHFGLSLATDKPENDGSGACAFLCCEIADEIHSTVNDSPDVWDKVAEIAEECIKNLPQKVNAFRPPKSCEPYGAYCILRDKNMLKQLYNFEEKVLGNNSVFSNEGRRDLLRAITSITNLNPGVALYTCEPYTIIIGNMHGKLFVVDTHKCGTQLGGDGNGLLKVFADTSDKSANEMAKWIFTRCSIASRSGRGQSFIVVTPMEIPCDKR